MTAGKTLLAHLSPRFTDRAEDIAVEALGYILSGSKAARDALEDVLRNGSTDVGPISRVATQVSDDGAAERTRPDIVCYDGSGAERVLVEAKFWAGLTDRQPVAYLKRLSDDRPSALLVIAPAARFESLWAELRRRIADDENIILGEPIKDSGLLTATAGERRRLLMTSWTALLDRMASRRHRCRGHARGETTFASCAASPNMPTKKSSYRCGKSSLARSSRGSCST